MAFSEIELRRIDEVIGGLCRRRSPAHLADKLKLAYEVKGHNVVVFEVRPDWQDPTHRMRTPIARFRFVRTTRVWTLFWMRADLKWHLYAPAKAVADLVSLVAVVDRDEHCAFFG